MPKFLFWNIAGRPIEQLVSTAVEQHEVDVLILAECEISLGSLLESLNRSEPKFRLAFGHTEKLIFFTSFHATFLEPLYETDRVSIRRLRLPGRKELLVAAAHLPSRMYFSEDDLFVACNVLNESIEEQERRVGHRRTILLGDLNLSPFDKGIVSAGGLHAVLSREVANRQSRTVQGREYHFFYNPMWTFYSNAEAPGTYYYERAVPLSYFWHIYDQVLLRPELLDTFKAGDVRVLTQIGTTPLLERGGQPDSEVASDHLPVMLNLDF